MGLSGIFKESSYKKEIEDLKHQIDELNSTINERNTTIDGLNAMIDKAGRENVESIISTTERLETLKNEEAELEQKIEGNKQTIENQNASIEQKKKQIICLDEEITVQEFGLYTPRFAFASSTDYKEALALVRNMEKECIRDGEAATGSIHWTINGSESKGRKMVQDIQKILLRSFNAETDELIGKVKYTNFDASLNKLYSIAETISRLGKLAGGVSITSKYIDLKAKELRLAFEFSVKKQEEKEELKELRAQEREAAKLQKELAEQRKAIYKEQAHYQRAFRDLQKQLQFKPDDPDLLQKKESLEAELNNIEKSLDDIDYREANQRAGYVYVISNIGAFGEDVYKIGMTRRLDPLDRVDELGSASVPFNFDVHAMIFSDDAPALESALHRAFEDRKVNMVNTRREFFRVTLDEIKEVIKNNFDRTVEFTDVADAEQYRVSERMRKELYNK